MSKTKAAHDRPERMNEQNASTKASLGSREITITEREHAVLDREEAAALREETLRAREQAAQALSERDALIVQLREANEHLVVANFRAQTAAEEAEQASHVAQEAVHARDDFLSMASHELRNPINALHLQLIGVLREADRYSDSLPSEWVSQRVGQARDQVGRLERLVGNLLDVTRIRAGRLDLELEDLDFDSIVQTAVNRFRGELKDRDVIARLSPVTGRSDRLRLDQIVTNLFSNAIKYGKGKPIEVSLEADGDMVRLSVTDGGIGIGPEHQKRIFDPFERAVSKRQYAGFGLGLWITRQIVETMRGHISVDTRPGQGSTFSVVLPRVLSLTPLEKASPDEG
jgi:signal transduction histidine kinase